MTLTIKAVNPLDHVEEIKRLFVDNERPDFPEFFDRAYPTYVRAGGVSWVGRDAGGRVVMHVACFPQRFRFGARDVVGGLLVNALVARSHRSFFPAQALFKITKHDARVRGDLDFLYTDPNDQAKAVLNVCGFTQVGTLGRYVLLLGDRRWLADRAIGLAHAARRIARRGAPLQARSAKDVSAGDFEAPTGDSPRLRPYHGGVRYAARLMGYPTSLDWWFTLQQNGDRGPPRRAGLLVRGPDSSGVAVLHAVRRDPGVPLGRLLPDVVATLRGQGGTRLQIWTLVDSLFAGELWQTGFVLRDRAAPIVAAALTAAGETVLRSPNLWEITSLDCDR
ncbi:MAG TPA: hypothetical protein VM716_12845 [Gemmatimonadales bacterium]|nr:hypothetical protein [Gemmatimonadales bacterium]